MTEMVRRDEWEKLGDTVVLRVSRRGGGLYLHLRKGLVEYHTLRAGDRMKVRLVEINRQIQEEGGEGFE